MSAPTCLRCPAVALTELPSSEGATFFECPRCSRHYAREGTNALTERWLGPLSMALYAVLFAQHPQESAGRVAQRLRADKPPELCAALVREIRAELATPTQPVHQILPGMRSSERDLREFLGAVADALDAPR